MDRRETGRLGERIAERLLRRCGLTILARNWRAAGGELDLAALEGETLVFVEVKTRRRGVPDYPHVRRAQRRRIVNAATAFRIRFGIRELPFRFDLVTVTGDPRRPRELIWLRHYHRTRENS